MAQQHIQGALASTQRWLDARLPPAQRTELYGRARAFATDRPYLTAFLITQLCISSGPLAIFILTILFTIVFALGMGLLLALMGAAAFVFAVIGVALCLLVPTIFFTTFVATCVFTWGIVTFKLIRWVNTQRQAQNSADAQISNKEDAVDSMEGMRPRFVRESRVRLTSGAGDALRTGKEADLLRTTGETENPSTSPEKGGNETEVAIKGENHSGNAPAQNAEIKEIDVKNADGKTAGCGEDGKSEEWEDEAAQAAYWRSQLRPWQVEVRKASGRSEEYWAAVDKARHVKGPFDMPDHPGPFEFCASDYCE